MTNMVKYSSKTTAVQVLKKIVICVNMWFSSQKTSREGFPLVSAVLAVCHFVLFWNETIHLQKS